MQKRRTHSGILKVAFGAGAALALTGLVLKASNRSSTDALASHSNDPATDYETAMARFAQVQAQEEAEGRLNPVCCSKLTEAKQSVSSSLCMA